MLTSLQTILEHLFAACLYPLLDFFIDGFGRCGIISFSWHRKGQQKWHWYPRLLYPPSAFLLVGNKYRIPLSTKAFMVLNSSISIFLYVSCRSTCVYSVLFGTAEASDCNSKCPGWMTRDPDDINCWTLAPLFRSWIGGQYFYARESGW